MAWERGLFLGNLRDLAAAPTEKAEGAYKVEMDIGVVEKMLAEDIEAVGVWNQAHIDTVVEMKQQFRKQAGAGNKHAMDVVLRAMRADLVRPEVDFNRVSLADVVGVCRITRQTVHTWVSRFAAPQNADGTYSLAALWGWYKDFILQKTESGTVKSRTLIGGVWSALNEADYLVDVVPLPGNLRLSEVHYNPAKVLASWGSWKLVEPNPSMGTSLG